MMPLRQPNRSTGNDGGSSHVTQLRLNSEPEGWILVGHQGERIAVDPVAPANYTHHKVEQSPRIGAREENGKPGDDDGDQGGDSQKDTNDVGREGQEQLDQGKQA